MNTSESDLINKTFYPGWLMVSQLRCGQPVTDGEALYLSRFLTWFPLRAASS